MKQSIRIKDLEVGDVLDLEGDIFADFDREDNDFEREYYKVTEIRLGFCEDEEITLKLCICVEDAEYVKTFWQPNKQFTFPPNHLVRKVLN